MSFIENKGVLKFFSNFGDLGSSTSPVGRFTGYTNLYNLGGHRSSYRSDKSELEDVSPSTRYYSELIDAVARLDDYRCHDFTETILSLYADALNTVIDYDTTELISIIDDKALSDLVNKDLRSIDYQAKLKASIKDTIYYGSYGSPMMYDKKKDKIYIKDIKYPYTTARRTNSYIAQTDEGARGVSNMLRFSLDDLRLDLDAYVADLLDIELIEDDFYSNERLLCGKPLFLTVEPKVKDYILKDMLLAFLSLIKLLEQDTYSIDVQRLTDMDSVVDLCERVKNLLVVKEDYNLLTAAKLDRNAILRRLFDNTRVIPSVASNLSSMQQVLGSRTQEKIDSLEPKAEKVRDDILTSIGFPLDLFLGRTSKWEVERQDDRYGIRVTSFKNCFVESTKDVVDNIVKLRGKSVDRKSIRVPFIHKTQNELLNESNRVASQSDAARALSDIFSTISGIVRESDGIPKEVTESIVKDILANIDPTLATKYKVPKESEEAR